MGSRRCAGCRRRFEPRAQSPTQRFCSAPACQRERRRRWQRDKRQRDPDYRDNQSRAQARWAESHPQYWREYRATHPDYVETNRRAQAQRDARRRGAPAPVSAVGEDASPLAKSDAWKPDSRLDSGTYRLIPVTRQHPMLAKSDAYIVEIRALPDT